MNLDDRVELVRALIRGGRTPQDASLAVAHQMTEDELFAAAVETLKRRALQSERNETLGIERAAEGASHQSRWDAGIAGHAGDCACEACGQWCERTPRRRHPARCQCAVCRDWDDRMAGVDARVAGRFMAKMTTIIDEYTETLRITWTRQLLAQPFRLADGTRVTWGEATTEQHQSRIDMLKRNAHANLEAAARHQRAIIDITQGGADTLAELLAVAA